MSVYCTFWSIKIPRNGWWAISDDEFVELTAQAVPPHITDYGDFLPPPVPPDAVIYRAVIICHPGTTQGTERSPQEYVDPLLVLTGEEYATLRWVDLFDRVCTQLARRYPVPNRTQIVRAADGTLRRIPLGEPSPAQRVPVSDDKSPAVGSSPVPSDAG